jgi:hypothetical protein
MGEKSAADNSPSYVEIMTAGQPRPAPLQAPAVRPPITFKQSRAYHVRHELALSTVTARRFCDQHEMSLHTATGRSLPYEMVRMRAGSMPREAR